MVDGLELTVPTGQWITADSAEFRERFNQKSFEVSHTLANHPLFHLSSLLELAERTLKNRPDDLYYDMGDIQPGQRWNAVPERKFSAVEALRQLENSNAWFIFRSAQRDPAYTELFEKGLKDIKSLAGARIESKIRQEDIIIFVTSPKRVTAYHIDRECNFLLQIRGDKDLYIFDREDREVLPEEEIERFWSVDNNAAVYKGHLQSHAMTYKLVPGVGVHIPVNCPHWLQNGDDISISLSVNFQFVDSMRANLYRANYLLRKLGFTPSKPGKAPTIDQAKSAAMTLAMAARRVIRREARGGRIWN
jgi:hypothetical protein